MTNAKCPFCGKDRSFLDTILNHRSGKAAKLRVQCMECFASTGWKDTAEEAWEAWNRRVAGSRKYNRKAKGVEQ